VSVSFVTPLAAVIGVLAVIPLAGVALRERRLRRVRAALGLAPPRSRAGRGFLLALASFFGLVALAAAQPLIRVDEPVASRTDAEVFMLVDVSRSMLAAESPEGDTRFERAVSLAGRLREGLADVPVGVASITDRPLPHLFPSADRKVFATVVERVLAVDRPPPSKRQIGRATELGSIVALGRDNYFSARSVRRIVLVLTDGETTRFDPDWLASQLRRDGVAVAIVRIGDESERIYRPDGSEEAAYRPDHSNDPLLARLAEAMPGGRVFAESEAPLALATARAYLGPGPTVAAARQERLVPVGGYVALAAALPLAFLLVRSLPAGRLGLRSRA
jgi:hypothetical protein